MTTDNLTKLARLTERLKNCKEELVRYKAEEYLNNEDLNPWISIRVGNHPTYLRDFWVSIHGDKLRKQVVKIMLDEFNRHIREIEKDLKLCMQEYSRGDIMAHKGTKPYKSKPGHKRPKKKGAKKR